MDFIIACAGWFFVFYGADYKREGHRIFTTNWLVEILYFIVGISILRYIEGLEKSFVYYLLIFISWLIIFVGADYKKQSYVTFSLEWIIHVAMILLGVDLILYTY